MQKPRSYIAIDLKSFYASQECVDRGLDPLTTNLVVADESRTEKTICLAVSPSLKAFGIPGRPRLFEVVQQVARVNALRRAKAPGRQLTGSSCQTPELREDPSLALDYIVARPRMAAYMAASARVYGIYLKYIAPEDIHVYSVDEVFIDATAYLKTYRLTAWELARKMIQEVLDATGITATAGIGPNLYLCKVAMDIVAKKIPADEQGVRIAQLTEMAYREQLWEHRPLTDFWRVGPGISRKLEKRGIFTMGDIARCSLDGEDVLYKLFGVNAQLLIDHAWGYESCTIGDIKAYKPLSSSLGVGQVLSCAYDWAGGRMILREMTEGLVLDMVEKGLVADQMVLTIHYDRESLENPAIAQGYHGQVVRDHYGRLVPKSAHGSVNLEGYTSSTRRVTRAVLGLYDRIVERKLLIRKVNIAANHILPREDEPGRAGVQMDFLAQEPEESLEREHRRQQAMIAIRRRFGKNAILKGTNLQEGATAVQRNAQIGGHRA